MSMTFLVSLVMANAGGLTPVNLRSEYLNNPIGIEETHPRLSWVDISAERGARQAAYRILVASSAARLRQGKADLWDSGKVASDQSTHVVYAGKPLYSRQQAFWKVQVWDAKGLRKDSAGSASWEMGLLNRSDWKGKWIGIHKAGSNPPTLDGANWIWFSEADGEGNMPKGSAFVHKKFSLVGSAKIDSASLVISADDHFKVTLNGKSVGAGDSWERVHSFDLKPFLKPTSNEFLIEGINDSGKAGIAAVAKIKYADGAIQTITTNRTWEAAKTPSSGWQSAFVVGPVGMAPWGKPTAPIDNGPTPYLRKVFAVSSPVVKARVYASALGLYKLYIDGLPVSHDLLRPGWTDYKKRVQYETYDVTARIKPGPHAIGMIIGNGWYTGRVGWTAGQNYGPQPLGLAQLELTHANGTVERITTDESWRVGTGPIVSDDLLNGETYDARKEALASLPRKFHYYFYMPKQGANGSRRVARPTVFALAGKDAWATIAGSNQGWDTPVVQPLTNIALNAQQSASVEKLEELHPQSIRQMPKGSFIYDLGQNMVGYARLKVKGPAGTSVRLRFAEMLKPDGSIYTTNLRSAKATDTYILSGNGTEVYEPSFTFHGFRYVEVTGYPGKPGMDAITGVVIGSNNPVVGEFECSSPLVNKLAKNIFWGQRGNYVDVPTDCPQRDERLGWMGDAQIFVRTATYNNDIAGFMTKWTRDVQDAQSVKGGYSDVSPRLVDNSDGAPAWGDAGVIVPWTIYQAYGDTRILEARYDSMARWIKYIDEANPNHIWVNRANNNFGDWLNVQDDTPRDVIGTAYFARSTDLMAQISKVLGKKAQAEKYTKLLSEIKVAFNQQFVSADGTIKGDSQTDYVLALHFGLLPKKMIAPAMEKLSHHILVDRKGHLSTGFVGVGYLCPTLTENGRTDIAYKLLNTDTYPSWGYSIRQGATTIWERWDGWRADKGFQDPGMNSFNHYSLGSVGEWMYNWVIGIDYDPAAPGYHHVMLHPAPGGGMTYAKGSLDTIHGVVKSEWHKSANGVFTLDVTVPANTYATLVLPSSDSRTVTESGRPVAKAVGIRNVKPHTSDLTCDLGGGTYHFRTMLTR